MVTTMTIEKLIADWRDLRKRIQNQWEDLRDEDLRELERGKVDLVDLLRRRYSLTRREARDEVERFTRGMHSTFRKSLSTFGHATADVWRRGRSQVKDVLASGRDTGQELWHKGRRAVEEGYEAVEHFVRRQPITAAAIGVGAGLLLTFLLLRRRE